jgi:hypothetical protein
MLIFDAAGVVALQMLIFNAAGLQIRLSGKMTKNPRTDKWFGDYSL